jgi:hypothetical protein
MEVNSRPTDGLERSGIWATGNGQRVRNRSRNRNWLYLLFDNDNDNDNENDNEAPVGANLFAHWGPVSP